MYTAVNLIGTQNACSVRPVILIERAVYYRERAAGLYSSLPYAMAQELPVWWRWFAWICPYQWSLYGLATSQYGNVDSMLDTGETVAEFVKNYFGFRYDFLGLVAGVLVALSKRGQNCEDANILKRMDVSRMNGEMRIINLVVNLLNEMEHKNTKFGPGINAEDLQGCLYERTLFLGQQIHARILSKMVTFFAKYEHVGTK
ncbi:hypothetical protein RJ641_026125 [Dillenia turbinata]|uniref:Uncharacterized protein n=1 Tax=Dillenia turbinata TaxID=194707 RepID=A0AAN8W275_9MAGN